MIISQRMARSNDPVAYIYKDGQLLSTIKLNDVKETYSFRSGSPSTGENTITVRPGEIGITEADCPDKVCVKTGFIHNDTIPIVCLPNKVIIEIHGGEPSDVDIISY